MHLLPNLRARIRRHHRKIRDQRIEFARESDGLFHRLFGIAGQTDDEEPDRFQADFFRVLERGANLIVRHALVNGFENILIAGLDAEREPQQSGLLHVPQQFFIREIRADAVDEYPRHVVQLRINETRAQIVQPRALDIRRIVEHPNLLRAQLLDEMAPFLDDILRRPRAPFLGHHTLRAERAAIRAAARGHETERFAARDGIHRRLQRSITLHLEIMICGKRQRIEVGNRGTLVRVLDLAVGCLVRNAENAVEELVRRVEQIARLEFGICLFGALDNFAQINPGIFAFAARDDINLGARSGLFGQSGNVRAALRNRHIEHGFDLTGGVPTLLDLRGIARDADNIGLIFAHEIGKASVFDIHVEHAHFVAAPFADRGKISETKMGSCASINRELKTRVYQ